jgi:hypothetical protein
MSTYSFNENDLNFFQKAVCLKSVSFEEASLSSVGTVTKILIIFVLIVVIVTCTLNIVANFEILNKPEELRDISKSYCIALLVFNFIVLVLSLFLAFFIIKAFWTDARNKKAVKNALLKAELKGAKVGTKIGVIEGFKYVNNNASTVIAEAAIDTVSEFQGAPEEEDLDTLSKTILKTVKDELEKNLRKIEVLSNELAKNYIEASATSSGVSFGVPGRASNPESGVSFGVPVRASNPESGASLGVPVRVINPAVPVSSGPAATLLTPKPKKSTKFNLPSPGMAFIVNADID